MTQTLAPQSLEETLRSARDRGKKLLVPYVTGGFGDDWPHLVAAVAHAGADAVEVGIPFSDPVMDGPVIQETSRLALQAGATPSSVLADAAREQPGVPLVAMTYYNLAFRAGLERFAAQSHDSGFSGAILADLPLDEAGPWLAAAQAQSLATILLVAPTTPPERMERICKASSGFVYGVGVMGVTGERDALSRSAVEVAKRLKAVTDLPVLIGVGVTDADQARSLCEIADGVIVGSALMRRRLANQSAEEVAEVVAGIRRGLDRG